MQEVSFDLSAFSSDIQEVATSVTVGYRINQANAMTIYKEVGRKYEDVLILPRVPEVVKAVVAHYDASSLISNRDAVAEQMDAQLRQCFGTVQHRPLLHQHHEFRFHGYLYGCR